ncbi:deoxyribonuclease IV [Biomaibacter acetigenes]|uniref:Probable endonuclease 4 n=1 Tax=Biomaibacter acetigenes TaxID=2316383 RepID=A0A3G2R7K8_9FIRM|nr:deoxyribonuclease IV [Biomaibacter acetigenes]AYO31068.1 deoxyribonuclease IV [Biomaibacter acetigenes]
MLFGAHISISKGYEHAVKEALSIGANTMQFFSRNPRGSAAKALDPSDIEKAEELCKEQDFGPLVAHAPYTLNLASTKEETRDFALMVLKDDMERLEVAKVPYMVLHPGSHLGEGVEQGVRKIASGIKQVVTGREKVMLLLETMAGAGSEVGYTFEQLYDIMDSTGMPEKFGICIDTCHLLGAGYDVIGHLDAVLAEFDRILGLGKIKAVHLNDSKFPLASRKDRHANLGEGELGLETIKNIITHPALKDKPFLLETPGGMENYKKEIEKLKQMAGD